MKIARVFVRLLPVVCSVFLFGCGGVSSPWGLENRSNPPDEFLRRANVELLVKGRNEKEVESLLGAPTGRGLDEAGYLQLDYLRNVFDEERGRVFGNSVIRASFALGLCSKIEIELGDEVVGPVVEDGVTGPRGEG